MNSPPFKWDDLKFLLAVATRGTFLGASSELGVSHTTVSRRIAAFEENHGVTVFNHGADGLVLTELGERLVDGARSIEAEIEEVSRVVVGGDQRLSGVLRISTFDTFAAQCAKPWRTFLQLYPEISLQVSAENSERPILASETDVAIRSTNSPPAHLIGRRLRTYRYAPFASRALTDVFGSELSRLPWLSWHPRLNAHLTEKWMRDHIPNVVISAVLDSPNVFFSFLENGLGAGFCPVSYGSELGLVQLGEIEPTFDYELWMLFHPDVRTSAKVRAFTDFMFELGPVF